MRKGSAGPGEALTFEDPAEALVVFRAMARRDRGRNLYWQTEGPLGFYETRTQRVFLVAWEVPGDPMGGSGAMGGSEPAGGFRALGG